MVPPGRLIPAKQLWGGNPCSFVKDLNVAETWSNYTYSYVVHAASDAHKNEFTTYNAAYLELPSYKESVEVDLDNYQRSVVGNQDLFHGMVKYYA